MPQPLQPDDLEHLRDLLQRLYDGLAANALLNEPTTSELANVIAETREALAAVLRRV
jgi:hypothetical protein